MIPVVPSTQDPNSVAQVKMILRHVQTLPALSPVAGRLLALDDKATVDLGEIARLVETDPVLSSRILGLCRKADKGVQEKITSVRRAVVLVGLDAVRSAVLGASAFSALSEGRAEVPDGKDRFRREGFWKYCVCVACTAELLAAHNRAALKVAPDEAFVAGLLHAIGKLVLDYVLPKSYGRVIDLAKRECAASEEIERRIMGVDYHQAGKALADYWQLPPAMGEVMLLHALPFEQLPDSENRALVGLISGSAAFVRTLGLGWSGDFCPPARVPVLLPAANIRPPEMAEFGEKLLRAVSERLVALGLSDSGPEALAIESLMEATEENHASLRHIRDLTLALQAAGPELSAPVAANTAARKLGEAASRAKQCLSIVTSKTQLLAMRLHDARDRAAALAIVEASRELESILETSEGPRGADFAADARQKSLQA